MGDSTDRQLKEIDDEMHAADADFVKDLQGQVQPASFIQVGAEPEEADKKEEKEEETKEVDEKEEKEGEKDEADEEEEKEEGKDEADEEEKEGEKEEADEKEGKADGQNPKR